MATKEDVERFLGALKRKIKVFGIIYRNDRVKNMSTIGALEILPIERTRIINELCVEDYSQGPMTDTLNKGSDMWVFGKNVKGKEIYIKVTMGPPNSNAVCISFHIAEKQMSYPFKTEKQ